MSPAPAYDNINHSRGNVPLCVANRLRAAFLSRQVYTAFDTHLDALGVYKLDTVGDAFVVVAGLDGFKSKEASSWSPHRNELVHLNCSVAPSFLLLCLLSPSMAAAQ